MHKRRVWASPLIGVLSLTASLVDQRQYNCEVVNGEFTEQTLNETLHEVLL